MDKKKNINIVYVVFDNGSEYPYINDGFDLAVGDKVYVDGKLKGKIGKVTAVLDRFKVSLKYYKYVLAKLEPINAGTFTKINRFFVSVGKSAVPGEKMISWLKCPDSPDDEPEEFICGKGCEFEFDSPDAFYDTCYDGEFDRVDLSGKAKLKFVSVFDGIGKAIVKYNGKINTVDFRYNSESKHITDMYCDCIAPGLCADMFTVAGALIECLDFIQIESKENFSIIDQDFFNLIVSDKCSPNDPCCIMF